MLYFYNKCDIHHDTVVVNRKEASDKITLSGRLSKEIARMIAKHSSYFDQFDNEKAFSEKFGRKEIKIN